MVSKLYICQPICLVGQVKRSLFAHSKWSMDHRKYLVGGYYRRKAEKRRKAVADKRRVTIIGQLSSGSDRAASAHLGRWRVAHLPFNCAVNRTRK